MEDHVPNDQFSVFGKLDLYIDFCMRSDNAVMEKISDEMIVQINYGYSSALAWVYFLIVMVIIGISSLIISKGVYYYE